MDIRVRTVFYDGNYSYRIDEVIPMSIEEMEVEVAKGMHPTSGKPMSPFLNHCDPFDAEAAAFYTKFFGHEVLQPLPDPDPEEEKKKLWEEYVSLGVQFDKRWGVDKLKNNLSEAKRARGVTNSDG